MVALPLLISGSAPVFAEEDERPDLKIEFVGVPLAPGGRDVQVRVTNVSVWWANETTLHFETVSPAAGNAKDVRIENLDPGQSATASYTLAAACNGQVVRAEIAAAANYAGVKESRLDNNRLQAAVCSPAPLATGVLAPVKTSPPPAAAAVPVIGTTIKPSSSAAAVNDHDRAIVAPKVSTLTLSPSAASTAVRSDSQELTERPSELEVGWQQDPSYDLDSWWVAQTAVNFDLRFLQQVAGTRVREAVLRYSESESAWKDSAGSHRDVGNCVEVLGRATEEWQGRSSTDFPVQFANENVQGHAPGVREWFVTSEIRDQWTDGVYPPLGFVLRGGNESPNGKNFLSCQSLVSDITLEVTYEVPQ